MKMIKFIFIACVLMAFVGCKQESREVRALSIVFNGADSSKALVDVSSSGRLLVVLAKMPLSESDKDKLLDGATREAQYSGADVYDGLKTYIMAVSSVQQLPDWFDTIRHAKNLTVMRRDSKGRSVKFYVGDDRNVWIVAVGDNWGRP
jgi:hypothetical protein